MSWMQKNSPEIKENSELQRSICHSSFNLLTTVLQNRAPPLSGEKLVKLTFWHNHGARARQQTRKRMHLCDSLVIESLVKNAIFGGDEVWDQNPPLHPKPTWSRKYTSKLSISIGWVDIGNFMTWWWFWGLGLCFGLGRGIRRDSWMGLWKDNNGGASMLMCWVEGVSTWRRKRAVVKSMILSRPCLGKVAQPFPRWI